MQQSQLNRVLQLVRKTGDKVVLMDNESDAVMMLMDLGVYEKMVATAPQPVETMTEEELMERINRDVAVWRAYNDKEQADSFDPVLEKASTQKHSVNTSHNSAPQTAVKPLEMAKQSDFSRSGHHIPAVSEESASDIVAEEEEEKFYLEPVE